MATDNATRVDRLGREIHNDPAGVLTDRADYLRGQAMECLGFAVNQEERALENRTLAAELVTEADALDAAAARLVAS